MEYAELWGYKVCSNGEIFGLHGKKIRVANVVKIKKDNKFVSFSPLRFIYYAFNQNTFDIYNYDYIVIPKDNDKSHRGIDNLESILKKDMVQGEHNGYSKLTDEQVTEIIDIYEHGKDNNVSYRSLAKEYGVSHGLISGIITGKFRNKNDYKLK
jgi:hypothetical protein